MVFSSRWLLIPAVLAGWLGLAAALPAAVAPVIKDGEILHSSSTSMLRLV